MNTRGLLLTLSVLISILLAATWVPWWNRSVYPSTETCPLIRGQDRLSPSSLVSKAHSELHLRKFITLIASTAKRDVGRTWQEHMGNPTQRMKLEEPETTPGPTDPSSEGFDQIWATLSQDNLITEYNERTDHTNEAGAHTGEETAELNAEHTGGNAAEQVENQKRRTPADPIRRRKDTLGCLTPSVVRAWQLQGFALANLVVLERFEGWVLFDVGESSFLTHRALATLADVITRAESDSDCENLNESKPNRNVTHILVTHQHSDHTGGIGGVQKWNNGVKPIVIMHKLTMDGMLSFYMSLPKQKFTRAVKQFGSVLNDFDTTRERISAGIGAEFPLSLNDPPRMIHPTHIWDGDSDILQLERGLTIELIHMPGETTDQVCFFVETLALFHMSDNFYFSFPNVYPLRGGHFRSPSSWKNSLDKFLMHYSGRTDVVSVGHTSAVFGKKAIRYLIERYRDALAFVHHQTVRLLDTTQDLDIVANHVNKLFWATFPAFDLRKILEDDQDDGALDLYSSHVRKMLTDPLLPFYGQLEWAVKAVGTSETGWFDGNPILLNSHRLTPHDRAIKLARLVLPANHTSSDLHQHLIREINKHVNSGECQWALELIDMFYLGKLRNGINQSIPAAHCPLESASAPERPMAAPMPATEEPVFPAEEIAVEALARADNIYSDSPLLPDNLLESNPFASNSDVERDEGVLFGESVAKSTPTGDNLTEKLVRDRWAESRCSRFVTNTELPSVSPVVELDHAEAEDVECLRKRALWCLADAEISSSGRNWYLSEVAPPETFRSHTALMTGIRENVILEIGDLDPLINGLSYRFIPFGSKKAPKNTIMFFLTLLPESASFDPRSSTETFEAIIGGSKTIRRIDQTFRRAATYEIMLRNQVFSVRRIKNAKDIDWESLMLYKSFDIALKWSGVQAMFLRKQGPPRLMLEGSIKLPTEYPVPVIALKAARDQDDIREKVKQVFQKKGKLSITSRVQSLVEFLEVMLSLESA